MLFLRLYTDKTIPKLGYRRLLFLWKIGDDVVIDRRLRERIYQQFEAGGRV